MNYIKKYYVVALIIKNDDGVYVLTPQINKSYKFQSKWPENSSQIYLIESIIKANNNLIQSNENGNWEINFETNEIYLVS